MKRLLCVSFALLLAIAFSGAALACCGCGCAAANGAPPETEKNYVEHEAVVFLKVPQDIRVSEDRRRLFAAYCEKTAKAAEAKTLYISSIYPESQTGWMSVASKTLTTQELIEALRKDPNVLSASPNYINQLNGATKVQ